MGHFLYVSDDTNQYRVRMDASNAALGGFLADDATKPDYPKRWRMRFAWCERASDGNRRKLPISDVTSDTWKLAGQTVSLFVEGTASPVTYNVLGKIGEKRPSE